MDSNHRSNLQQIYSLSPLATRESTHLNYILNYIQLCIFLCKKPMIGLEPITCWLQISCSANWATSAYLNKNGTNRARTCDPLLVRQVLSQLSYDPRQTTPAGLEPATSAVTGRRSNQLSHEAIMKDIPSKLHTDLNFVLKLGQALDLLVTVSSMYYYTSTSALSTL